MTSARKVLESALLPSIRYSVRQKLMLVVLTTTLVALALSGASMLVYELQNFEQTEVNDLMTQADIIGRASAPALAFDDVKAARENLAMLRVRPAIVEAAIFRANSRLFAEYTRDAGVAPALPAYPEAEGHRVEGNKLIVFKSIRDSSGYLGTVYIEAAYSLFDRLWSYLGIFSAVMVVSLMVAVLMSFRLQEALTTPILAMTQVAREVMERRDFSLRVGKTTEDEVGYLVDTFNEMLAEVGKRAHALEQTNRALEHEMEERRTAEAALRLADQRKDEFLATLAHELRNPLAPLRNALEILRRSGKDESSGQFAHDMMTRQLRQLVRLVDDLLDVSRITTGKIVLQTESATLEGIIRNAVEMASPMIEARGHQLTVELPPQPVPLQADTVRLAQVFQNLLNNAAKFTSQGGRLDLHAERENGSVVVTVTDSGIGIPPQQLGEIFNMFSQVDRSLEREHAGLGVGLTLARRLVEMHGGSIEAYSDGLGKGSRFVVRLPVTETVADRKLLA
jgi:two-component system, sensor histidine kinase